MADIDAHPKRDRVDLYEADFAAWADQQASLTRAADRASLDLAHIAEELEALATRERRELRRRLARLIQHLLKWAYQPEWRSRSWSTTIMTQRAGIADILRDSPSLRPLVDDMIEDVFRLGRAWTAEETGLLHLPDHCPWTAGQLLRDQFLPDGPPERG
jgi:hypothetical protein